LYEFLGIPKTDYGETVGWYVNDDMDYYWIDFNHGKTVMDDGLECWMIETVIDPMPEDALL
ncbi:MAG: DUF6353 family protein, partial [Ruminococcus sp.]|nr:DUF6353 family protein [Ruminococcus sp.]